MFQWHSNVNEIHLNFTQKALHMYMYIHSISLQNTRPDEIKA